MKKLINYMYPVAFITHVNKWYVNQLNIKNNKQCCLKTSSFNVIINTFNYHCIIIIFMIIIMMSKLYIHYAQLYITYWRINGLSNVQTSIPNRNTPTPLKYAPKVLANAINKDGAFFCLSVRFGLPSGFGPGLNDVSPSPPYFDFGRPLACGPGDRLLKIVRTALPQH